MKWKRLVQANTFKSSADVDLLRQGIPQESLDEEARNTTYWINDIYQIARRIYPDNKWVQLNIRRRDGKPIFRDWRQFQRIKNELIGPECEAIELYPAESRKIDTSNKYHLWGVLDPKWRFPVGFTERDVRDATAAPVSPGIRQRALDDEDR